MANGNGRNGARRQMTDEELAKQQRSQASTAATEREKARADEMLLPEERRARQEAVRPPRRGSPIDTPSRRRTARAGRAIEQRRAQPRGRRIRL